MSRKVEVVGDGEDEAGRRIDFGVVDLMSLAATLLRAPPYTKT